MHGDAAMRKYRTLKNGQCLRVGICFATSYVVDGIGVWRLRWKADVQSSLGASSLFFAGVGLAVRNRRETRTRRRQSRNKRNMGLRWIRGCFSYSSALNTVMRAKQPVSADAIRLRQQKQEKITKRKLENARYYAEKKVVRVGGSLAPCMYAA